MSPRLDGPPQATCVMFLHMVLTRTPTSMSLSRWRLRLPHPPSASLRLQATLTTTPRMWRSLIVGLRRPHLPPQVKQHRLIVVALR